ncbi:low-density lipoprotein receptor class A domain-containing protein 1-like [Hemiscyllium ocellatum]|uniref:low-density lipoprotein receptor class A domain-containing protein 1-like n=1 Tax=Hemiscyllium ocellatum TaxID=170820 RepID=UPI002966836C|nr:low-density lipoprotein receptor class A domain-containing protein 1-like [Hemiscyllium ocellatum]
MDSVSVLNKNYYSLQISKFKPQDGDVTSVSSDVYSQFGSQMSLEHVKYGDSRNHFPRRCLLITCVILLILGAMAAALACVIIFGIPPNQLTTRLCKTTSNTTGFLCDDHKTCIMSTQMCNGKVDCSNGEDESNLYCGDLPNSLPRHLVFMCDNQKSWTYMDKMCDGRNHCGDCSDESELLCPACTGWKCVTVFFNDCDCIPKSRCRDNFQDCTDMSDEKNCTK